ncbi:low molecular weight phosphatase family protein [Microbacterium sp. ARD32]|uniref:arsenate reductase/protein-tyrosine-phosphatase family protein n=1 Tax=Microbacterium sp. ARD32 TaxID=2962577 RepID=UPI00288124F3|nr:low molecular weight phosphatase family protein [Microbacterium sp. ARD32]MDT0156337.1 low molecular weight phosphatase family protein [Microbacterium sp. ARD32]
MSEAPTILAVCTGNICRSPIAESILNARLRDVGVRVRSAGVRAAVGQEMPKPAQRVALSRGADARELGAHTARAVDRTMLLGSDLVIAMTREHRSRILALEPTLMRRTFTAREFARLAAMLTDTEMRGVADRHRGDPPAGMRAVAAVVAARRGASTVRPKDDDVIDPYRRSSWVYERSTRQLDGPIAQLERVARMVLE